MQRPTHGECQRARLRPDGFGGLASGLSRVASPATLFDRSAACRLKVGGVATAWAVRLV